MSPTELIFEPLDAASRLPLYQQLQHTLRKAIESNVLGSNQALPGEREIASMLAVSRITVRKAIQCLVEEGLVVQRQGAGNFVCPRIERNFSKLSSFSEDMRSRGFKPSAKWLKRSTGTVTPEESLALRLGPGTPVYRFHRLRFADDVPMAIEYATVIATALPSIGSVESSLYEALERTGHRPECALQRIRAIMLMGEKAQLLNTVDGMPGLLLERLGSLRDGRAVEFSNSYYRGDMYDFVAELNTNV